MFLQFAIGTLTILATIAVAGGGYWMAENTVTRVSHWLIRRPHAPKLAVVLMASVVMVLVVLSISVWIWALIFLLLEVFIEVEASVYFSIVAFTTLGFGDILLPHEWRILGGLTATNGLLNMGLYTALLVEILRRVRSEQIRGWTDE